MLHKVLNIALRIYPQGFKPLTHNVLKWSHTLSKSYSIGCKILKDCLTILGYYVLKG